MKEIKNRDIKSSADIFYANDRRVAELYIFGQVSLEENYVSMYLLQFMMYNLLLRSTA